MKTINLFNYFEIPYDFQLLFSINKEYTLDEFIQLENIALLNNFDDNNYDNDFDYNNSNNNEYYDYLHLCKFKYINNEDIEIIKGKLINNSIIKGIYSVLYNQIFTLDDVIIYKKKLSKYSYNLLLLYKNNMELVNFKYIINLKYCDFYLNKNINCDIYKTYILPILSEIERDIKLKYCFIQNENFDIDSHSNLFDTESKNFYINFIKTSHNYNAIESKFKFRD